jgi:hypothetical protein
MEISTTLKGKGRSPLALSGLSSIRSSQGQAWGRAFPFLALGNADKFLCLLGIDLESLDGVDVVRGPRAAQ